MTEPIAPRGLARVEASAVAENKATLTLTAENGRRSHYNIGPDETEALLEVLLPMTARWTVPPETKRKGHLPTLPVKEVFLKWAESSQKALLMVQVGRFILNFAAPAEIIGDSALDFLLNMEANDSDDTEKMN